VTWVDSFTGRALDLDAIGTACRDHGVLLVANASQALGTRSLDVTTTTVDAVVSCGYKWLCGPYGTGFTWLDRDLLDRLRPQQAYWLAMQAGRTLDHQAGPPPFNACRDGPQRCCHRERHRQLTAAGIDTAYREANLRFSLHLFNTADQIDRALHELHT
jgi:selenocysteine lyase/cysteine desulfurase